MIKLNLKPNLEEAVKFLELLDDSADYFTFQTFCDYDKSKRLLARTLTGTFEELKDELVSLNNKGAGIFVTINKTNGEGRTKKDIEALRACFFDKDDGAIMSPFPSPPTMLVKTAAGYHGYYCFNSIMDANTENVNKFRLMQQRLADFFVSDKSVKDESRVLRLPGFYHIKDVNNPTLIETVTINEEYYSLPELEDLFPAKSVGRPQKKEEKLYEDFSLTHGRLKYEVKDFFDETWDLNKKGNNIVVHSIANCKKNAFDKQECIDMFEKKGEPLDFNTLHQINSIYESDEYEINPYYGNVEIKTWKEFVWTAKLFKDINAKDEILVLNEESMKIERMTPFNINSLIPKKLFQKKLEHCKLDYNPTANKYTYSDESGYLMFNTYVPPFWKKENYFRGNTIETYTDMPDVYKYFFNYLFKDNKESIEYVLNWVAHGIQGKRNIPILALVGTVRGIGKNVFGKILEALHGIHNYTICSQQILKKEFNKQVLNKTLVHFDEVSVTNDKEFEAIKAYTNSTINVEGKGIDADTRRFWGNILLTNNVRDSLIGVSESDDRQFSIPILSSTPLNVKELMKFRKSPSIDWLWDDKNLINQLAGFLYGMNLEEYDYVTNFKSAHYFEVVKSSKTEWVRFIIEDLYMGHYNCAIPVSAVRDAIKISEGIKVGRTKLEALEQEYESVLRIKRIDNKRYLFFSKKNETSASFCDRLKGVSRNGFGDFEELKEVKEY